MIEVTGIWIRNLSRGPEILIEVEGKWRCVPINHGKIGSGKDSFPNSEIVEMELEKFPKDWLEDPIHTQ